ncbi:glycoside hydrolase superfamily [Daedaleopsis nitida]|nr:glycoside hydrolase superfamily [Daedaleopsis nitida]
MVLLGHTLLTLTLLAFGCLGSVQAKHNLHARHPPVKRSANRCRNGNANPLARLTGTVTPIKNVATSSNTGGSCFPALDFKMPDNVPDNLSGWWCDPSTEYAFVGFSYEISACQDSNTLKKDFKNIRDKFDGRYVRLYGACTQSGYYNKIVDAAWEAGVGVHALIWFGFDGGSAWKQRRDDLFNVLHSNPKAKFVTRAVQFGSEPLFDGVLPPNELASQVKQAKDELSSMNIPVTISEMAYGFQMDGNTGLKLMSTIDQINAHILPFFGQSASTAKASWGAIQNEINNFWVKNAKGKKIYLTENGWPSKVSNGSMRPNSGRAQASVKQEQDYFDMLDDQCQFFKGVAGGGVAWFAHIYSDAQEEGYGILDVNGNPKFPFKPKTHC